MLQKINSRHLNSQPIFLHKSIIYFFAFSAQQKSHLFRVNQITNCYSKKFFLNTLFEIKFFVQLISFNTFGVVFFQGKTNYIFPAKIINNSSRRDR